MYQPQGKKFGHFRAIFGYFVHFPMFLDWGCNIFLCTIPQKAKEQEVTASISHNTIRTISTVWKNANFPITQKYFAKLFHTVISESLLQLSDNFAQTYPSDFKSLK